MTALRKNTQVFHTLLLLLAALIWGFAFSAQSIGADYVPALSFTALRSWIGFAALYPACAFLNRLKERAGEESWRADTPEKRNNLATGAMAAGLFIFLATVAQQVGLAYTTAAKSSFITALYVVLVPIISIVFGRRTESKIWICVALSVAGLYLLCMTGGPDTVNFGDAVTLISAVCFSFQILVISRYVKRVDAVKLTQYQFLVEAVLSTVFALLFERPTPDGIIAAMPAILYAGFMSSAVGYTLQAVGQKGLNPTIACLAMCMESVFGALGGWMILQETMTLREASGCALMFVAIVLSQVKMDLRGKEKTVKQPG